MCDTTNYNCVTHSHTQYQDINYSYIQTYQTNTGKFGSTNSGGRSIDMNQLHIDNDSTNDIDIFNLLFILIFIVLIVGGCSLSVNRISDTRNTFTTNQVIKLLVNPFQEKSYFATNKAVKMTATVKNRSSITSKIAKITHHKPATPTVRQSSYKNKKAILGMFLVMLRSAHGTT